MTSRLGGVEHHREGAQEGGKRGKRVRKKEKEGERDNQCKYVCQKRVH